MKTMYRLKSISLGVLLGLYGTGAVYANPTGADVVHGSVSFHAPNAQTLQITNSPNAIINWQGFSIDAGETTQFIQQSANSAVLNRVVGDNLSQIHGSLLSNGRVFLINQAGIVFGDSASIDTAGLVASTLNISDQDFLDGNFHFESESAGSVINRGVIAAGPGGEVVFIAPQIENSGSITVEGGALILAAGKSVTLSSWDLEGVEFEVQAPDNSVLNLGELVAEQGAVGLFAGSIRNEGLIEANSLSVDAEGNIVLSAQQNIELTESSAISASGDNAGEIVVISEQGDVYASGSLSASSEIGGGGSVHVLGERVALLDGAHVNASGATGGGEVLIGGDFQGGHSDIKNAQYTHVAETAVVNADALETGDGGKAIVWADKNTVMLGEVTAKGGAHSGDGGLIEVSGKESLVMRGTVDATAANGERGNILFDPKNISVGGGGLGSLVGNVLFSDNPDQDVTFNVLALTTALLGGNVSLQANNDVTFTESFTSLGNGSELNIDAGRSVVINAGVVITLANGDFNVLANAPSTGATPVSIPDRDAGAAEIRMLANSAINTNGGTVNLIVSNGDGRTGPQTTMGNVILNGGIIDTNGGFVSVSGNSVELAANSHIRTGGAGSAGGVFIEANDFNIDGSSTLDTSGFDDPGIVAIAQNQFNQGQNISLGYATAQAGTLSIESAEIDRINGHFTVGNGAHTGRITVGDQVSGANVGNIALRTSGDVVFAQNANGIGAGANNVLIDADKIEGSATSVAPDILANEVTLVTNNGIEQTGGGALSVSTSKLIFTNSTGGDVIVATQGGGTVVEASSNVNGGIDISQLSSGNLTLDGVSIGSGIGSIAAHTSQTGSNVVVGTGGGSAQWLGECRIKCYWGW